MTGLAGKVVIVSGGTQGLGAATVRQVAACGAAGVVIVGRGADRGRALAAEIEGAGTPAAFVQADMADPAAPHAVVEAADERFGVVHGLVNIAASTGRADVWTATTEHWDDMMAVNVRAPFFLIQQLLPIMCKDSSIVLVSSVAGHAAIGTLSAYAATKGAIDTLVKHFAAGLGERGIRVNAVAPGVVATDMSSFTKTDAGRNAALGMQALKRLAQPDDIGGVVAFLASDDARWITGDTIRVDGGSKL